jgi:hypothetical protein
LCDPDSTLEALMDLARELGLTLRRAPGALVESDHPGGALVRLKGAEILFLNPQASTADQIDVLARALRARPELEGRFLRPDLRELLEDPQDPV